MDTPTVPARQLRVVLIDDEAHASFAPLLERRPFPLLPVLDRPLIEWIVAAYAEAGVRRIDLISSDRADAIAQRLGDGSRWGVTLQVHDCASVAQAWADFDSARAEHDDALAMRTSVLPEPSMLTAMLAKPFTGDTDIVGLGRDQVIGRVRVALNAQSVDAQKPRVLHAASVLGDVQMYWRANLLALRTNGSRLHRERCYGQATYIAAGAVVDESVELDEPCRIGPRTRIERGASIGRDTIVFRDAIVGRGVVLRETVVLPGTIIADELTLTRKIVDGAWMIDVETGDAVHVDDPRILANADVARAPDLVPWTQRLAAVVGLALGLSLLAPWALWRRIRGARVARRDSVPVREGRTLDGTPLESRVGTWTLEFGPSPWRRLPWLWLVARGRRPVAGALPE